MSVILEGRSPEKRSSMQNRPFSDLKLGLIISFKNEFGYLNPRSTGVYGMGLSDYYYDYFSF